MRAIVIKNFGGPENLIIKNVSDPHPLPHHVILNVKAFGLNRAELYFRAGLWGDVARISGIECVGTIHNDPDNRFKPGQKVLALMGGMGRSINGSYAEMVSVPSTNVVAIDTDLSWVELAAIPETYATAWACLNQNLELASGQTILIRGATSALGRAAINIASGLGARIIATTRNKARLEMLEDLGTNPVLDADDLSNHIRQRHDGGIDAVLDIIGNRSIIDSLAMVRFGGRVCLAGFLGGSDPISAFNPLTQMPSAVQFSFFASAFTFGTKDFPLAKIPFQSIINQIANGKYPAKPARIFDFNQIVDAHRIMEANTANGKLVVKI